MLVSLQSYTLLHFKRKQLLRWNVCQLSEDRNIRNIPSVTKGETHTNRLSFRLNKHKVSYFRLLRFYFESARAPRAGGRRAWMGATASSVEELSKQRRVAWRWCSATGNCWSGDTHPARFSKISYTDRKKPNSHQRTPEIRSSSTLAGETLGPSRNTTAALQQPKHWNTLLPANVFVLTHPWGACGVYLLLRVVLIRLRQNCKLD